MWRPLEQFGLRRVLATVSLSAASFMAFRFGFAQETAERAVPLIAAGCVALSLAVGLLTMKSPWQIFAVGLLVVLFWGGFIGGGAALLYLIFCAKP
jgi:hypothetical protein